MNLKTGKHFFIKILIHNRIIIGFHFERIKQSYLRVYLIDQLFDIIITSIHIYCVIKAKSIVSLLKKILH